MGAVVAQLLLPGGSAGADVEPSSPNADEDITFDLTLGIVAGAIQPDPELENFRWDVSTRSNWGAQALLGHGRFAGGLRLWRSSTTQATGIPGVEAAPTVRLTSLELLMRGRLVSMWGFRALGSVSAGWLHLGYDPDQAVYDPGVGGPIVVTYDPVNEPILAAGLALERSLSTRFGLGLSVEHQLFGLDTAHRRGDEIVFERTSFNNWTARLELSWLARRW